MFLKHLLNIQVRVLTLKTNLNQFKRTRPFLTKKNQNWSVFHADILAEAFWWLPKLWFTCSSQSDFKPN